MTGTPVQNNLQELYSLLDIVNPGLLGTKLEFNNNFAKIIQEGLKKNALPKFAESARECIKELKSKLFSIKIVFLVRYKPHIIRRLKSKVFSIQSAETNTINIQCMELPIKTDLVVWIPLSDA